MPSRSHLTLAVAGAAPLQAYRVDPDEAPVRGGVIFLHWFDPQAEDGNRTQFLDEAKELAAHGIVSVLPELVFLWQADPTGAIADAALIEAELARLGAAVDALANAVLGPVILAGHDFGAMHGVLLMARDQRVRAGVLIAPANRWADWFLRFWPITDDRIDYQRALRRLDPIEHVAELAPRPLLLQFAERDYFIAGMDASELYRAAGEPRTINLYESDHAMRDEGAVADRRAFILDQVAG